MTKTQRYSAKNRLMREPPGVKRVIFNGLMAPSDWDRLAKMADYNRCSPSQLVMNILGTVLEKNDYKQLYLGPDAKVVRSRGSEKGNVRFSVRVTPHSFSWLVEKASAMVMSPAEVAGCYLANEVDKPFQLGPLQHSYGPGELVQTTIKLSNPVHKKLTAAAKSCAIPVTVIIRSLLDQIAAANPIAN